ncbi:MAG: hypothetical protein WA771_06585 [Chthoniobacterales bacterium]
MAEQDNSPARFPIWIVGVIIGVVIGAAIIFGLNQSGGDNVVGEPTASASPSNNFSSAQSDLETETTSTAIASLPDGGASYEDWDKRIADAPVDEYGDLMNEAVTIQDPATRKAVVERLLLTWLDTDQSGFLNFLDDAEFSQTEGSELWPALVPAAAAVLPSVSESAAGSADLDEIIQWMVEYYSEMDPAAAAEWTNNWLLEDTRDYALATVAGEMALKSREEAETLLGTINSSDARMEAVMNIGAALAESDSDAALAWARALPNEEERTLAVEEVLWTMSETDPSAAAARLTETESPGELDAVSGSIAEEWAIKDPAKAIGWAEGLPQGAAREEAIQGALAGWAENDPRAAFAHYQSNFGQNLETAEWIFDSWAFNNPNEASAEVMKIANPEMRARAVSGVVSGWLDEGSSVSAVENWVDSLPAGRERDEASYAVVDMLSFDEPEAAWTRAATIQEPDVRTEAIQTAFAGLVDIDPAKAETALRNSNLSPEEIGQLQGILDGGNVIPTTPQTVPVTAPSVPAAP